MCVLCVRTFIYLKLWFLRFFFTENQRGLFRCEICELWRCRAVDVEKHHIALFEWVLI